MAIKGSLKEASLPDVLQLLAMGAKTGCLSVTDRSNFGYIYFENGRIIYASLLNRRDRLGDILVKEGEITREQLEEAIEVQGDGKENRRLGEILRDRGSLDEETLQHYVRLQIEEAVYHLFTWSQGTFYFEPGQHPEKEPILVSINPEMVLLEGARRVDEWEQIEKKIPSFDLIFTVDQERLPSVSNLDLTEQQKQILPHIDGERTVWDLMEETALPEFDVGKALYGLMSAGFVRRSGKKERDDRRGAERARVGEHRNLGVAFYKTSMFEEAVREFRRVLELEPGALDAAFYLGLVALREDDAATAVQHFRDVLDRGGARAPVYANLAVALERLGKRSEAIDVLDEGLEHDSEHPKLLLSKAVLQLKVADPASAKSTLESYRDVVGDQDLPPLYYAALALADGLLGDLESAGRVADTGVARHPMAAALVNNAGVIFERLGDLNRCYELYEQAFSEDRSLPQASKNLGDLHYRDGEYEEAAESYERALRADARLGDDTYAKLGNVYYKSRAREKAIEMWERALQLNPDNEVVRTNLELVKGAADEG